MKSSQRRILRLAQNIFEIWQPKDDDSTRDLLFEGTEYLASHDLTVDLANYEKKYTGDLKHNTTLEDLYFEFNMNKPDDFMGHSMSDLVILNQDCEKTAHYCDRIGFTDVTDFVFPEEEISRTSESTQPEKSLNGISKAEIEEDVLARGQEILAEMGLSEQVELHAARVFGSRTREGLFDAGSDIDVVLSYSGNLREDTFFNAFHAEKWEIAGLTVDVNPISTEKVGSLEEYLKAAEKYLDEKEQAIQHPSIRGRLKAAIQRKSQPNTPEKSQERKKNKGQVEL